MEHPARPRPCTYEAYPHVGPGPRTTPRRPLLGTASPCIQPAGLSRLGPCTLGITLLASSSPWAPGLEPARSCPALTLVTPEDGWITLLAQSPAASAAAAVGRYRGQLTAMHPCLPGSEAMPCSRLTCTLRPSSNQAHKPASNHSRTALACRAAAPAGLAPHLRPPPPPPPQPTHNVLSTSTLPPSPCPAPPAPSPTVVGDQQQAAGGHVQAPHREQPRGQRFLVGWGPGTWVSQRQYSSRLRLSHHHKARRRRVVTFRTAVPP